MGDGTLDPARGEPFATTVYTGSRSTTRVPHENADPMTADTATAPRRFERLRSIHPGWILAVLDVVGLAIASYLAIVEVGGGVPACGPLKGCETVAQSEYAKIGGIPVAVFGVALSLILLTLALAWIKTDHPLLLDFHYGLSLIGVIFEVYFLTLQVFVIQAVCIWCTLYGLSLIARFVVAMVIWLRRGRFSARYREEHQQ
jgi:uncharacterized membrane protein